MTELLNLWHKTQEALRKMITSTMFNAYGTDWIETLKSENPSLMRIFEAWSRRQQQVSNEGGTSESSIHFATPQDLFEIICTDGLWEDHFQPIFGHDRAYWTDRMAFLWKCRNVMFNSPRELDLPESEKFKLYCHEILRCV